MDPTRLLVVAMVPVSATLFSRGVAYEQTVLLKADLFGFLQNKAAEEDLDAFECRIDGYLVRDAYTLKVCARWWPSFSFGEISEDGTTTLCLTADSSRQGLTFLAGVEALQYVQQGRSAQNSWLSVESATPYAQALARADPPYFLRYSFLRDVAKSRDEFHALSPLLAKAGVLLHFGHTQQHRLDGIEALFPRGEAFVEVGCGPAYYLRRFSTRYRWLTGFEADPVIRKTAQDMLANRLALNVQVQGVFDETSRIPAGAHVLMTEVLEHMPLDNAKKLLRHLAKMKANRMVFTVPNREFNPHYYLAEGERRHYDHYWEPNATEFEELMAECLSTRWTLRFSPLGDSVDGVSSGLLCLAVPFRFLK